MLSRILKFILPVLMMALVGCASNKAFRTTASCGISECKGSSIIEKHDNYDLAFVEFSEKGNVFSRQKMKTVLDYVDFLKITAEEGLHVVVFVHGWRHNAHHKDGNVESFKKMLELTASLDTMRKRKILGVYIGWRGLSFGLEPIKSLSYWERKAVAHQVGKGGVTELLLKLERKLNNQNPDNKTTATPEKPIKTASYQIDNPIGNDPNKHVFIVVGHSFGSAIVLSGLNEVLMERVISGQRKEKIVSVEEQKKENCIKTRPFGHGVILINPAVEANEILQLKELVSENCFVPSQDRLMHIISSDADSATSLAFPFGQFLGDLNWNHAEIDRPFLITGENKVLDEFDLNINTAGNFEPFLTGYLMAPEKKQSNNGLPKNTKCTKNNTDWTFRSYLTRDRHKIDCFHEHHKDAQHIRAGSHEPLAFIKTDGAFIENHNDIFNENVGAYIGAIVSEARNKRCMGNKEICKKVKESVKVKDNYKNIDENCSLMGHFSFGNCFKAYQETFCKLKKCSVKINDYN